ncbi:hypothetical protein DP761_22890 [Salmonella enterica subsp. enterica]|nr:hypothetical protein [Salmonella enterica subsp. enterica serovar Reading]MLO25824.1 hypothetical protein [Salmonella enterica subsp. enterica serovar Reading]
MSWPSVSRSADYDELTVGEYHQRQFVVVGVPSRLIGQLLRVRLWDDRLSCYLGSISADEMMAVAAADRLIHHGYMFELKGENYSKKTAKAVTSMV